jgi:hypothetical protein
MKPTRLIALLLLVAGCDRLLPFPSSAPDRQPRIDGPLSRACDPKVPTCAVTEYCAAPPGCQQPGTCEVRPQNCNANIEWVCGCDGKSYSLDCVAFSQGTSVMEQGRCCADIVKAYADAVASAKQCCSTCTTPSNPCTAQVGSALPCLCPTYVNAGTDVTALDSLIQEYAKCPKVSCQSCPPPPSASCQSTSGGGICVDG